MSYGQFSYYTQYLLKKNFQVCVHAIGDSANKLVINNFKQTIPEGFDARWRIEHAQIVDPRDQKQLSNWGIIPSIQTRHGQCQDFALIQFKELVTLNFTTLNRVLTHTKIY
jgi:predicted amidohydrolase YtcJ